MISPELQPDGIELGPDHLRAQFSTLSADSLNYLNTVVFNDSSAPTLETLLTRVTDSKKTSRLLAKTRGLLLQRESGASREGLGLLEKELRELASESVDQD